MPTKTLSYDPRRAFWQRFIDEASFDLPSQPAPTHGGSNWVKIELPSPVRWITGYGKVDDIGDRIGFYLSFDWKRESPLVADLFRDQDSLKDASGISLNFDREKRFIGIRRLREEFKNETEQIEWLVTTANGMVNAFRPYLLRMARSRG